MSGVEEVVLIFGIISAVTSLALGVYSYVKASGLQANSGDVGNTDLSVTQATEGMPVALAYGKVTICGNVVWWKYNAAEAYRGYRWVDVWQTICFGPIDEVDFTIYRNDDKMASDGIAAAGLGWTSDTNYDLGIDVDYSSAWNKGYLTQYYQKGDDTNVSPKKADGVTPIEAYATRLRGIVHVNITGLVITPTEGTAPTLRFQVIRELSSGPINYSLIESGGTVYGSNPAAIIYDILTNTQYGLGRAASEIDVDNFNEAAEYFNTNKLGLNFTTNNHNEAREIIAKIQSWVDCLLVVSSANQYQIKILKETDVPAATITDNDFIDPALQRKSWDDTYNDFVADWTPDGLWLQKTLNVKNEANIYMTGNTRQKKIDLTAFTDLAIASSRLHTIMKKESYPYATMQFATNLRYSHLSEGDVVTVSSTEYGISAPFRIISKDVTEIDQNKVGFQLMQMTELIADSNYTNAGDPLAEDPDSEYYIQDTIDEEEPMWTSEIDEQGGFNDIDNSFLDE